MSVKVNKDICIGCGACAALCPGSFKMNEESGLSEPIEGGDVECAKRAAETCPVQAITVD